MLIVDDKTLAAAGVDYATALALLKPAAEEVVVHVTRIPADGGDGVRLTYEGPPEAELDVPTIKPPTPAATAHPMPEVDRGFSELADMARDRRLTLTQVGGVYTLIGAFKMMHFHSLAQVHDAMRHNRYD